MESGGVEHAGSDQEELDAENGVRGHLGRVSGEHHEPGGHHDGEARSRPAQEVAGERRHRHGAREAEEPQVEEEGRAHHDHEAQDVDDLDGRIEPCPLAHGDGQRRGLEPDLPGRPRDGMD